MRLNLKDIIPVPGAKLPFSFSLDLSQIELNGERPISQPLVVEGIVRNMAGALILNAEAVTTLRLTCDRCTKSFSREKQVFFESLLATELENEEDDEIILLDGNEIDMGELMTTAFILDMDTKNLCTEDCEGLCSGCGANLNHEDCHCKREVDSRLAGLAKFFEQSDES